MRNDDLQLELVSIAPATPLRHALQSMEALVNSYAAEIAARRHHLSRDLELCRAKLRDLGQLDPDDISGLGGIYRAHVMHIEGLLEEFDEAGAT